MQPKKRIPKQTTVIDVKEPRRSNNGDIIIVPKQSARPLDDDRYEEMTVNRVRYQVPEETVILDFWSRLTKYVCTHYALSRNIFNLCLLRLSQGRFCQSSSKWFIGWQRIWSRENRLARSIAQWDIGRRDTGGGDR
jgi:hypothetical protein